MKFRQPVISGRQTRRGMPQIRRFQRISCYDRRSPARHYVTVKHNLGQGIPFCVRRKASLSPAPLSLCFVLFICVFFSLFSVLFFVSRVVFLPRSLCARHVARLSALGRTRRAAIGPDVFVKPALVEVEDS